MNKDTKEWLIIIALTLTAASIIILGAAYVSFKQYAAFYGVEI